MARQITLTLDNGIYNVLRCNYVFNRGIDYRGLPTTGLLGGDIKLEIETTGDDYLWERLSGRKPRPVSGKLEIFDVEEMSPIRVLEWYDGYIYAVEEGMYSLSSLPMTQKVLITTKRMDINSVVKLDRRFPETSGFWWEEYKEPEPVVVVEEESDKEEDTTPHIVSIAWLDEEDKSITFIPSGLEETVTMHVETTGFDKPENGEEDVLVQIKDEEERVFFEYTTRPNEEGVIDLDLTVEEIISEKHDNPVEYLKEHPNLKLCLFASCLHNPDEQKEAILEKEQPEIVRLEWQDNKRTVLTHVPEGQNKYVDIYIEAKKFKTDEEGKCPDSLCYEILDDDKNKIYEGAATLNENGCCIIGGFDLQGDIDQYLAENKLPALTTRPFNYTLRAWFESNPDDPKEAVIQEEMQCTVLFRRLPPLPPKPLKLPEAYEWEKEEKKAPGDKLYYDGSYLFDWVRTEDTKDIDKWDKALDKLMPDKNKYYQLVANEYESFEETWKTNHSKWEKNNIYYIPWLSIHKGQTVKLQMKLEVEKPSGTIQLKLTGNHNGALSILSAQQLNAGEKGVRWEKPLLLSCNGIFTETVYLEAYAGEIKVGALAILPNTPYPLNIKLFYVDFKPKGNLAPEKGKHRKLESDVIPIAKNILKQFNIEANFEDPKILDFTQDKEEYCEKLINGNNEPTDPKESLFTHYFTDKTGEITQGTRIIENSYDKKYNDNTTFTFLDERCKEKLLQPDDLVTFEKSIRIYIFGVQGNLHHRQGKSNTFSLIMRDITGIADEKKTVLLFNRKQEQICNVQGPVVAHEILHNLGLPHPYEDEKGYKIYNQTTDNIMDYRSARDYRISLFNFQRKISIKHLKQNFGK